jgi:mannose-6-phosphate isomerase-like protein (cupin superfamily)
MREAIVKTDPEAEFFIPERCHILEILNSDADPTLSVARARVEPGITTVLHRLNGVEERYVILEGLGRMEVGGLEPTDVRPGDVVLVPAGTRQRIVNTGESDLIFLCVCTPRFYPESYEDLEA